MHWRANWHLKINTSQLQTMASAAVGEINTHQLPLIYSRQFSPVYTHQLLSFQSPRQSIDKSKDIILNHD